MSENNVDDGEAINLLYETIKHKFDKDGVLNEIKCLLTTKMVAMVNGKGDGATIMQESKDHAENSTDPRIELLHQLIVDYLKWRGFVYTAQMFASETGVEFKKPMRESLEALLGPFKYKEMPILLEMVVNSYQKQKKCQPQKSGEKETYV